MPVKYAIHRDLSLVHAVGVGPVTFEELMAHLRELVEDPGYAPPMKKLVDYRAGSVVAMSGDETRKLSEFKREQEEAFRGERCAFLVRDDADYGMSRVHGSYVDGVLDTAVFRDLLGALDWLSIDRGTFESWLAETNILP